MTGIRMSLLAELALATKGFMPADRRRRVVGRGGVGRCIGARRPDARGRLVLRSFDGLARRCCRTFGHGCCSQSTTTEAPRRTRRGGSTTTPMSSTPAPERWTRCRSSGARCTTPTSKSSVVARRRTVTAGQRRCGPRRCRSCSSTAGTASEPARLDYEGWTPHVAVGGTLAIHDVFPDPADGGRPPYEQIYLPAIESGRFEEAGVTGSLRILRRV